MQKLHLAFAWCKIRIYFFAGLRGKTRIDESICRWILFVFAEVGSDMPKILLIYNPNAGKAAFVKRLSDAVDGLVKGGYRVEVYPTQARDDLTRRLSNLEPEFDRIAVAGGDGTLNAAATAMTQCGIDIPLGYYPMGSTNDVANSLGIPKRLSAQTEVILNGAVKRIDTGTLEDRCFVYVAAFGAFTNIPYQTKQKLKKLFGHFAYLTEIPKELLTIKPFYVDAASGGEKYKGEYAFGMITSSTSVGGYRNVTGKNVSMSDGLFEVTIARMPGNLFEWQQVLSALYTGKRDHPLLTAFQTSEMTIAFDRTLSWTRDGEYGGDFAQARITCHKETLPILVPQESGAAES